MINSVEKNGEWWGKAYPRSWHLQQTWRKERAIQVFGVRTFKMGETVNSEEGSQGTYKEREWMEGRKESEPSTFKVGETVQKVSKEARGLDHQGFYR